MSDKLVDIINICDIDDSKIEDYIIFSEDEIGSKVALVYKKYYIFVLNNFFNENTINIEQERELLITELDEQKEKLNRIRSLYCLGESYFNEGNLQKSEEYFLKVLEESREDAELRLFYSWARKNLSDLGKEDILEIDEYEDYTDLLKLEISRSQFKNEKLNKENMSDLIDKHYKNAMYTAINVPNYRDTLECAFKYFNDNKCYKKTYELAMTAYKNNKDKVYLYEAANAICFKKEYNKDEFKEVMNLINLLSNKFMFNEWSRLAKELYKVVSEEKKIELLELISNTLKNIKLNTKIFKKYKELNYLILSVYDDLNKNKYRGAIFAQYEKIFLKYTLYTSYQNNNIATIFDSYTKLEVLKSNDTEIKSALKLIGDPNIKNSQELQEINICPFTNQYMELKITSQNMKKSKENITRNYEKYKNKHNYSYDELIIALNDVSSDIIDLKNEIKENVDKNIDIRNSKIKSVLQVISDLSILNKTLKESKKEYVKQFSKEEGIFKEYIKKESYVDIKKIVHDSYEEIQRGNYPSVKLLYKDFNNKINIKIYKYINEEYKTLLLNVINKILGNVILFMRNKDYLINKDIDEVIKNNPDFESELKNIYEKRLDYHLVYNHIKSEMNKIVENMEYEKQTSIYIKQPKWYSNILGSLFEEESEKLEQAQEHIFDSWEIITSNILNQIDNQNQLLISNLLSIFAIYSDEKDKTTNYNVKLLDCYIKDNVATNNKFIQMKINEENIKENIIKEYNTVIKHINEIKYDVDKYENQIKRKVIYIDGILYRIIL